MKFKNDKEHNLILCETTEWVNLFASPVIIAGPCSAESFQQLERTIFHLKDIKNFPIRIVRAGIWKPRSRPNCFEGRGVEALNWLKQLKKEYDIQLAVEVGSPLHVELCLKYEVDFLWLGARTTSCPFLVQEIANSLKGTDQKVLVKNPINPDLNLWIGAFERLNIAGIRKLVAVHRGFSTFSRSEYRNDPCWKIPIELKLMYPKLPFLCDPSHICGERTKLQHTSQLAFDLDMQGLMIECHNNPQEALSDAEQQITPQQLQALLSNLEIKMPGGKNLSKNFNQSEENKLRPNHVATVGPHDLLNLFRAQIDLIDSQLIQILFQRLEIIKEISKIKRELDIPSLQVHRWIKVMREIIKKGNKLGLNEHFLNEIFHTIHLEAIRVQHENRLTSLNDVDKIRDDSLQQ